MFRKPEVSSLVPIISLQPTLDILSRPCFT